MIKKDIYLLKPIAAKENGFPKVITGIRRCGKLYLLTTIFKTYLIQTGILEENGFTIIGIADFLLRFIK